MSDILSTLASTLAKQGAPMLGGLIGTAIGGPVGAAIGGLAGKAIESLADAFGVPATSEAVTAAAQTRPDAPAVIATVEAQAPALIKLWEIEAQRVTDAQAAEIDKGFGSWQFWRGAWQGLIIGGWAVILFAGVFGGGHVVPMLPMADIVSAWGSVTLTWLAVFNGGHTLKEIAPSIGFGRKRA
ncbi:hypothetical protein [Bosea lathyri]|uniref:Holin of 3TMs, for gene-transfer release n=1 Tax=Bosea lathyri TaxID=1036778 RepID=A0A1H6BKE9_9HYPH|nr:hypothetical protein [Bosea lathyri]SEG61112.1 hypothetical protein SAMN04488115_107309 [Bosea lathyri]